MGGGTNLLFLWKGGKKSSWTPAVSVVAQSLLDPVLFNIIVNDLSDGRVSSESPTGDKNQGV